jgi:Na+/melibiose symporter-like transporter
VVLAVFGWWELRIAEPMLNLHYFKDPRFSTTAASAALVFFSLFGATFFLTQYLQFVMGYSALDAGVRIMPIATMVIGAPVAMKLTERLGAKIPVASGMLLVTAALALMATCSVSSGYGRVALVLALLGLGMGMTMAPATDAIMSSLPPAKAGVGSAVNDTIRLVGGSLGVAVLGSVLSSSFKGHLTDHFPHRQL